jgi:hypothetical protein
MDKQMDMFDNGGLMQEGGSIDPVSGNDVPVGSTQEEVRDDIPAQLSEGEFVFPADVVRYIGLENLMRMRQEAKMGLAQMEAMGQMGNSEEATMPDDLPFDMYDLEVEDDGVQDFAQGGVVQAQAGTFVPPQQNYGISGFQQSQFSGFQPQPITPPSMQPLQPTSMQPLQPTGMQPLQTTGTPVSTTQVSGLPGQAGAGFDVGPPDEYKTYRNESGQEIQVPFKDGKVHPTFTVPSGYTLATGPQETKVEDTTPETTQVTQQPQDDDDGAPQVDTIISGDKGQFSTTDMRGVGYDRGAMQKAAKEGSVEDQELLDALNEIAKAQAKDVRPLMGMAIGLSPVGSALQEVGTRIAQQTGVGKYKETKGVNPRREFLTSQKVTMDAFLSGLDNTYGGTRDAFKTGEGTAGQRLHELAPEVKRSLAGELKATQTALNTALEGKTMEDLRAEISNTEEGLGKDIAELGLSKTYNDGKAEREKTYGQLFAEARATKSARDKVASQYGFDASGMSLSDARKKGQQIEQQRKAEAAARAATYARQDRGDSEADRQASQAYSSTGQGRQSSSAASYSGRGIGGEFGMAKGGLAKQMEKSGLTPKK